MKKVKSIISVLCSLCLLAGIFSFTAVNAEASYSDAQPRTVRIRCMWNSNYIYNDAGQAKYAPNASMPATDLKSVWNIEQNSDGLYTIRNAEGSYLYASGDTAKCSFGFDYRNNIYYWDIKDAGDGKVRIISAADTSKAINIENLTGSLQLTTYYDTWESARWIIEDTVSLNPTVEADDRVLLQYGDMYNTVYPKVMYGGINVGSLNDNVSTISDGKFLYRLIKRGTDGCYIEYAPINGAPSYLYAVDSYNVSTSANLVKPDLRYQWTIKQGVNGKVSFVSVPYPDKCITIDVDNTCILDDVTEYGNWCVRSSDSLTVCINDGYKLACSYDSNNDKAYFRVGTPDSDRMANWQVIYKGSQFYLKNVYNGKYLMTTGTSADKQLYDTYYSAANDSQYLWSNEMVDGKSLFIGKNSAILYRSNEFTAPKADRNAYASSDSYNENISFNYVGNFIK